MPKKRFFLSRENTNKEIKIKKIDYKEENIKKMNFLKK